MLLDTVRLPPTPKLAVPAVPTVPLKVPLVALLTRLTVMVSLPPDLVIVIVVGAEIENACAPSPETV